jgi:hypothetical protein
MRLPSKPWFAPPSTSTYPPDLAQPRGVFLLTMMYDPTVHHRDSIRLKGTDYAQAGV